jgi:hypothetical protein
MGSAYHIQYRPTPHPSFAADRPASGLQLKNLAYKTEVIHEQIHVAFYIFLFVVYLLVSKCA